MYTDFFHLSGLPFQLTPDSRFFFGSSVHSRALAHLTYGLNQGEGFIIITGDVGAGKTTLVEHLCAELDPEKYITAKITTTNTTADDTLRLVANAFGIETAGVEKATVLSRLEKTLASNHQLGKRCLLIVDEAQNLAVSSLEELRMLSNFTSGGSTPPLQSFLLGQPQFRAVLAAPELEQLRQRVLASYHLGPMSATETRAYIEHRLHTVQWNDNPHFTDGAFVEIHRATGGVPRKINTLCSRLLLFAFLEERASIDAQDVVKVAEDLEREIGQVVDNRGVGALRAAANGTPRGDMAQLVSELGRSVRSGNCDEDVLRRLRTVEDRVEQHHQTIQRAIEIASRYVEGG
ncbi:XrtA/PEP-CTERM system-associated ATPase [Roseiterribacter gracilis]|uniref:ATPase n=1 Tax=Roseiterribacter gracilis TaxID=2812848 RepID=A0A8S8XAE8_9PROT|nr:ATPase [Rhodospirillales bacterium TMPK1]